MKKILKGVSEFTVGDLRAHRRICRAVAGVSSFLMLTAFSAPALAAGTAVLGGDATLTGATRATLNTGSATDSYAQFVADAGAKSAVLDWSKFNVGAGKEMNFSGAGTTFFNLVDGAASKSQIDGLISGNGSVWVINPNGIAFGANAQVNVGGTFAAAAGNLSNAADLRSGAATAPTFSSFAGEVSSASGSKFTADQVALLGKTVSAAGDYTGVGKTDVAAAGSLVVDNVAGGRISIEISDFAEQIDVGAVLGDLAAGDSLQVMSDRKIEIKQNSTVTANKEVVIENVEGDISVAGRLESKDDEAQIDIKTALADYGFNSDYELEISQGDINVSGDIVANGNRASITLSSGVGVLANGNISVDGSISADGSGSSVSLLAGTGGLAAEYEVSSWGSASVAGSVSAKNGILSVRSGSDYSCDRTPISVSGSLEARSLEVDAIAGHVSLTSSSRLSGDTVSVSGTYGVSGEGSIDASDGTLTVLGGVDAIALSGSVKAKDATFSTRAYAAYGYPDSDVTVNNAANDFTGKVTVEGKNVAVADANDLTLDTVYASGDLTIKAGGDVSQTADGSVKAYATDALTSLNAGGGIKLVNAENNFHKVSAQGQSVELYDKNSLRVGTVTARDAVKISASTWLTGQDDSSIDVSSGSLDLSGEVIDITGQLKSKDATFVATGTGEDSGSVGASNEGNDFSGKVTANGRQIVLVDANEITLGKVTASDGRMSVSTVNGNLTVTDDIQGKQAIYLTANNGSVEVGSDATAVKIESNASVHLQSIVSGDADASGIVIHPTSSVKASDRVDLFASEGDICINKGAVVCASGDNATVLVNAGNLENSTSCVHVDGELLAPGESGKVQVYVATKKGSHGDVDVKGSITAGGDAWIQTGSISEGCETSGDVSVDGEVKAGGNIDLVAVNGTAAVGSSGCVSSKKSAYVVAGLMEGTRGEAVIEGNVEAGENVYLEAGLDDGASGEVRFAPSGAAVAGKNAYVVVRNGDLVQEGVRIGAVDGRVDSKNLKAALSAEQTVNLIVNGGSIGAGDSSSAIVLGGGKVYAKASGDISIAAANRENIKGGPGVGLVDMGFGKKMAFGDPSGNSNMSAGGDLNVYTASKVERNGFLQANGNVTVSASSFGDVSYLRAGGTLTINNVGKSDHPQIAYFESVDGHEPKINNQPNDTVIFVDGRLAGGNLKILNQFGANEAFMVSTPELKSTQGIFGNPTFLHSDLDVANPMEVSAIDYMLQETPRLMLDKDFPSEVDSHVDSVVVPEKDSIQFGRGAKDASADEASEKKTAGSCSPACRDMLAKQSLHQSLRQ